MPVTQTPRDPFTIITEAENSRQNWLQRNFGRSVTIMPASRYAGSTPVIPDINGDVVVERSTLGKLLPVIILLIAGTIMGSMTFSFSQNFFFPGVIIIPIGLFFLVAIGMAVYNLQRKEVDITLNKSGIQIGPSYFAWKQIRAPFVVERPHGKTTITFLVFVTTADKLEYFELTGFPTWSGNFKKLCTAIHKFHSAA
jgi:hypothetical protein